MKKSAMIVITLIVSSMLMSLTGCANSFGNRQDNIDEANDLYEDSMTVKMNKVVKFFDKDDKDYEEQKEKIDEAYENLRKALVRDNYLDEIDDCHDDELNYIYQIEVDADNSEWDFSIFED